MIKPKSCGGKAITNRRALLVTGSLGGHSPLQMRNTRRLTSALAGCFLHQTRFSSTAYATQEILVILAAVGAMAFGYVFPISIVIVVLLAIVVISYVQIIHAYPDGGGAYIVAYDNLGRFPALVAAAALLTDYILTVSVSVSSGVAQIVSAYPQLFQYRVLIALLCVVFITVINLRGG